MSQQRLRYQKVLESIPCHPDSISSIEIKDRLLAAGLLSERTDEKSQLRAVQRCINDVIADHASIEFDDQTRPYRYQIAQGHRHPVRPDGMSSVVSLQIIEKEIKSMLPPTLCSDVDAIFSSLTQQDTKQTKLWRERFCYFQNEFPLLAPAVGSQYFKLIEQALLEKKDIQFDYQKRGATEPSEYHATPLGLFLYGNSFYLVTLVPNTLDTFKVFALHRIHSLKLGFTSTTTLAYFNLKKYVQEHARHFSGGDQQRVVLRIENYSGLHLIEETLLCAEQKIRHRDEHYTTIEAVVRDSHTFEWWLMKHSNIVEIIEPLALREKIIGMLTDSLKLYGQTPQTAE